MNVLYLFHECYELKNAFCVGLIVHRVSDGAKF
jgi:hypothetical protein